MKNKALLTAIIFTYNHKKSIAKCIESVVNQNTDYIYEVHIWDDCSIDGTSDICRQYVEQYPDKIKLVVQPENTFLKPYLELQSYAAIKAIDTKYFCIIDGDDYWCDSEKIQIALDFLEKNPKYVGFAHDTLQVDSFAKSQKSHVHELIKWPIASEVTLTAEAPFFLTSSRIFRKCDYAELEVLPIDYLLYYYHLAQGPIYYYDKIMATYVIGDNNTFATLDNIKDLNGMFAYKLSLLFAFAHDDFCTQLQKKYDMSNGVGSSRYNRLLLFKKIFGVQLGWKLWFISCFVFKYGIESMDMNYVYSRELAKKKADRIENLDTTEKEVDRKTELQTIIGRENRRLNRIKLIMKLGVFFNSNIKNKFLASIDRKNERLERWETELALLSNMGRDIDKEVNTVNDAIKY